jgi:hypothetical protein
VASFAGVDGDETASGDDGVEGTIDHQVFNNGKRFGPPGFDDDRLPVPKTAHIQLARRGATAWAVGATIDHQATTTTDAFPAIVFEGNRLLSLGFQPVIDHIEHFEK